MRKLMLAAVLLAGCGPTVPAPPPEAPKFEVGEDATLHLAPERKVLVIYRSEDGKFYRVKYMENGHAREEQVSWMEIEKLKK